VKAGAPPCAESGAGTFPRSPEQQFSAIFLLKDQPTPTPNSGIAPGSGFRASRRQIQVIWLV